MITPQSILEDIDKVPPLSESSEREYLGASAIGHECVRYLWLQFHKYLEPEKFPPRLHRLFNRGHQEEGIFEMYLRESGFEILESCFSQKRFKEGFFSGAADGIVQKDGIRYACEYKTHSDDSFKKLKVGELEKSFPKHFAQCQINAQKFDCVGTIYLAVNKNNDELFCDIIYKDEAKLDAINARAEYITHADKPPEKISNNPSFYICKMCHAKDVCHGFELPRVHCFNCATATKVHEHGAFGCEKAVNECSTEAYHLPAVRQCQHHAWNPYAMNDLQKWEPIEFFPESYSVKYKKPDGSTFINGAAPFGVESNNLK